MGLKYDSGESQQMISALQETISLALAFIQQAESGIDQLVSSVGQDGITGKAYESGKKLFSGQIKNKVQELKRATDKLKRDLAKYKSANQKVSHYGHIDEEHLEETKSQIQKQISNLKNMQHDYRRKSSKAHDSDLSLIYRSFASKIQWQIDGQHEGLHAIEKELDDLRNYNQRVSGLFEAGIKETTHVQTSVNSSGVKTSSSLMKELKGLLKNTKDLSNNDAVIRLQQILKLYPKGIVKQVIASEEFWTVTKAYLKPASRIKLIQGLIKYEKFGNKTFAKFVSINRIGASAKYMGYIFSPLKSITDKSLKVIPVVKKVIGKGGNIATWATLGITFASSVASEFPKTRSIGKAVVGGGIDTVKSVGPFIGATIGGAAAGAVSGAEAGSFAGFGVGTIAGIIAGTAFGGANAIFNFKFPHAYSDIKTGAYKLYDKLENAQKNREKIANHEVYNNKINLSTFFNVG